MANILRKNLARDYALTLSWRFAEVEFLGLPNLKDERVFRLENIYVPLRLCQDWKDRFNQQKTSFIPKALQEHRRMVVLGDPGSGKSTLVKVLTYAFGDSGNNVYKQACGELIPIPIILREYQTHQWNNYQKMLSDFITKLDDDIRSEVTPEWLLENLHAGKAILLIDGLDEVGNRADREHLRDEIIFPFIKDNPDAYIILTSRIVGYEEVSFGDMLIAPGESWIDVMSLFPKRFYVAPFNDEEVAQFVTRWYKLRESYPDKQREGIESLTRAINQNDRVKRLAHNPQLLTLIALIYRVTANLPSGRVKLYDKIVEAYLETIQLHRKLGTPATLEEMKRWLAKVGWEMQERRDHELTASIWGNRSDDLLVRREEIAKWLMEAIKKERGESGAEETADGFLDYVARRAGLLVPRGPEEFAFAHLTFQEYFAAFELRSQVRRFDKLAAACAELVAKRHWHETLCILFEMLTEFPGADDDLLDEIVSRVTSNETLRGEAAKLFSALLPDEQNGLSKPKQREAAAFALAWACDQHEESYRENTVLKDLLTLPPDQKRELIAPWFAQQLQEANQKEFGKFFFTNGAELLADWPARLSEWLFSPACRSLTDLQAAQIAVIGARDQEASRKMLPWMAEHLPLNFWLRRVARGFGDGHGLALIDLYRNEIYEAGESVLRGELLVELCVASAITRSLLPRLVLARKACSLPYESVSIDRNKERQLCTWEENDLDWTLRTTIEPALERVAPRDLARDYARSLLADGSWSVERSLANVLAREMSASVNSPFLESSSKNRRDVLIVAEAAPFAADVSNKRLLSDLQKLRRAADDWTRLLALSALIALGEGSPDQCRDLNTLIAKGIRQSKQFTFPSKLHAETTRQEFRQQLQELFDLTFLQDPDNPWLRPELFDPVRPESKYFLAKPPDFFLLAAEVLDPKAETELGKWRSGQLRSQFQ